MPSELVSSPDFSFFWRDEKRWPRYWSRGIEQDCIPNRQAAVKELAAKLGFRQELECATLPLRNSTLSSDGLLGSLHSDSPFVLVSMFALNLVGYLPKWPWGNSREIR